MVRRAVHQRSRCSGLAGLVVAVSVLLSAPAHAAASALEQAQRAIEALDYRSAQRALAEAEQTAGNDLPTTLRILELQGIVAAALGEEAVAAERFGRLLYLAPSHQLSQGLSPRLTAPFEAARAANEGKRGLEFDVRLLPSPTGATAHVEIQHDPLQLARGVRVRVLAPPPVRSQEAPLLEGKVSMPLPPSASEVVVELLGAHGSTVSQQGPLAVPGAPRAAEALQERPSLRPYFWTASAGAGAALAGGVVLGLRSQSARQRLLEAREQNPITNLTQREASELNARSVSEARIANVLFVSSAALALGATVLFLAEPVAPEAPSTSTGLSARLAAGPGGVVLVGRWA